VITAPIASWLDILWEAVCARAARPIPGVLLDQKGILKVAKDTFDEFLKTGGKPEATLQAMLSVLTQPVQQKSLKYASDLRNTKNDPNLFRNLSSAKWEHNPSFPDLISRDPAGQLTSREWTVAEPVLWHRAAPIYRRLRISETDARDVYAETIADFLKAREASRCPMREMLLFEELPRLFAVVAERRAISWVRKQTTLKMQPNRTGLSLDDPDSGLSACLKEPRSLKTEDPIANANFDEIRNSCPDTLDEFEWHLLEILFVEGSKTRDELVQEDWTLQQLEVSPDASRSTKLRRLNSTISDALARLGRALGEADL